MVNNFGLISGLLKWDSPDDFYFLQILQRNKEHPNLGNNNRRIREYYIHNIQQLDESELEILQLCNTFNARAYIHVNRRNRRQVALEMLALLAHNIKSSQYEGISRIYESICGKHHSQKDKTWVVDVDTKDKAVVFQVTELIANMRGAETAGTMLEDMHIIPTKNGYHVITPAFNSKTFAEMLPELTKKQSPHHGAIVEIHKNNPTLLYVP